MSTKTPHEWIRYHNEPTQNARDATAEVHDIIVPSFNALSLPVKRCFISFAAYHEDARIPVDRLLSLWSGWELVAGLQATRAAQTYLNKLKDACLIHFDVTEQCVYMHDVLRDLAVRRAREAGWLVVLEVCPCTAFKLSCFGKDVLMQASPQVNVAMQQMRHYVFLCKLACMSASFSHITVLNLQEFCQHCSACFGGHCVKEVDASHVPFLFQGQTSLPQRARHAAIDSWLQPEDLATLKRASTEKLQDMRIDLARISGDHVAQAKSLLMRSMRMRSCEAANHRGDARFVQHLCLMRTLRITESIFTADSKQLAELPPLTSLTSLQELSLPMCSSLKEVPSL